MMPRRVGTCDGFQLVYLQAACCWLVAHGNSMKHRCMPVLSFSSSSSGTTTIFRSTTWVRCFVFNALGQVSFMMDSRALRDGRIIHVTSSDFRKTWKVDVL